MKRMPPLGEQEMEILKFIDAHFPVSVRVVAQHFEVKKKLARTTVLTVMERLRKKGFLSRAQVDGVFQYSAKIKTHTLLSSKISEFVEKTLDGSVSPLLSYFMSSSTLTKKEIEQLKGLVKKLDTNEESHE